MTEISTPLPLSCSVPATHDRRRSTVVGRGILRRLVAAIHRRAQRVDRGDPLATPSRRAIESTGLRGPTY